MTALPAFAQEATATATAAPAPAETADAAASSDIVVTGSLLRNPNLSSVAPISIVDQKEISLRQAINAETILRDIPGVVPSIGSQVNNGNGGASFVNLRGLGTNRNIVLLDGDRIVPADLTGVVDLNNIPLALVKRVDVLTGGASTTYGADAISGVVNFVTRTDFSGVDATVQKGITQQGDGATLNASLTLGGNFADDKGNAVVSVGYQNVDPVYQESTPLTEPVSPARAVPARRCPAVSPLDRPRARSIRPPARWCRPMRAITSIPTTSSRRPISATMCTRRPIMTLPTVFSSIPVACSPRTRSQRSSHPRVCSAVRSRFRTATPICRPRRGRNSARPMA